MTTDRQKATYARRVYPLDAHDLTEEQIAVAFAMTSRRPEAFDEIAKQVSEEKAADFHERWVLGYGHGSVAEHAVVHLAVENVSRLACDTLEDNRLASYTEKSSRYQVMAQDYFYFPEELSSDLELGKLYTQACKSLFREYLEFIDCTMDHLRSVNSKREKESDSAYNLRLRRFATDNCRAVLPAATLTNVGVTANARVLEHAISKLLSSGLAEERDLGNELAERGREITPTLIKYADRNPYLADMPQDQIALISMNLPEVNAQESASEQPARVRLAHWDAQAVEKIVAAILYRHSGLVYEDVWRRVLDMAEDDRNEIIRQCLAGLGPHDAPIREFELAEYTFEFVMDYGAYREFKRHRMMSYIPQPLTVSNGFQVPSLISDAGLGDRFQQAMSQTEAAFRQVSVNHPLAAQYVVTHAHYQRVLAKMNVRECFHLFKLRTSQLAHYAIREPVIQAMKLVVETHPGLFSHLSLRDYPDWWPFTRND